MKKIVFKSPFVMLALKSFFIIFLVPLFLIGSIKKNANNMDFDELKTILELPEKNRKLVVTERKLDWATVLPAAIENEKLDYGLRWKAVSLYGFKEQKKSLHYLVKLTKREEWFLRNAAFLTIQSIDSQLAVSIAKDLIKDKALIVRSAVVDFLSSNMSEEVKNIFWTQLDNPINYRQNQSLWVRSQMMSALAKYSNVNDLNNFKKYIKDNDSEVSKASIQALLKISGPNDKVVK